MPTNAARASLALAAFLATLAPHAGACGVCVEDRVAAVYDHAVVEGAYRKGHAVAFLAIEGADAGGAKSVRAALGAVPGIEAGTVRVSVESASCSVAFDPARASAAAIAAEANRRLARSRTRLSLLRVGRPGSGLAPD